ncbi:EAL and HDOD domain-containing protein [Xylophilus sp. GOD-11R]|uniref:EAL and HDOD domain-containing protein n=1 Tax=Xylophilus sp. GOD-11R TaxID=3089814 RepID=UPI00298D012E|nr:HDOD domain-containing protein [Xylophilus sp. GOD-11R]WPB58171.1 HDOD domain-containing protein [Xylophilus sp. GOD-11R]
MTTTTPETPSAIIARQAIVNADRAVVGYELFDRSQGNGLHTAASDVTLIFNALSHAGTEELIGRLQLFINCTPSSLAGGHLDLVQPEKFTLEIPPAEDDDVSLIEGRTPVLASLRERGFQLAFEPSVLSDAYQAWASLADYIKFDLAAVPADQLERLVRRAQSLPGVDIVAEKVETEAQFESCRDLGFGLFQGYWFARPAVVATRLIAPSQLAAVELVNLVRRQASTDEIEQVLKKDAGLAFNLMRLINSAGFGMQREVTSFRHAVMILGLKKLFRWAALLLLASKNGTPPAMGSLAVVRGRLMELLVADRLGPEVREHAFVAGIFSMLDVMLGLSMEQATKLLTLPDEVVDALMTRSGPLGTYLQLTEACESGDEDVFRTASESLGLTSQEVNWAHLQALAWSDGIPTQ